MIKFNTLSKVFVLLLILLPFIAFSDEAPRLNNTLPNFSLQDINGNTHTLYEYRGKMVMLFTLGHG